MKVLVIGGTGWVGHHMALACSRAGYDTTVMCRNPHANFAGEVAFLPMISGSKTDRDFMHDVLAAGNYDVVMDSIPHPDAIALLAEFHEFYDRYIQCGSVGVCAPPQYFPADEAHPYGPKAFKGKLEADLAMFAANEAGILRGSVLRPCCIAGAGKLPLDNIGGRRADFIPDILESRPLDILDNGNALLQIVHVRDLGRAFALAAAVPASVGKAYNICGKYSVTVRRYCELNAQALGKEAEFVSCSFEELIARHGESIRGGLSFLAEHMCFDSSRAAAELNWIPEYSPEAAIAETAYFAKNEASR